MTFPTRDFSDGFGWFEFEWGILRAELQIQIYLVKSRKPKENLRFSKKLSGGLSSRWGRGNKIDENGNRNYVKKFLFSGDSLMLWYYLLVFFGISCESFWLSVQFTEVNIILFYPMLINCMLLIYSLIFLDMLY